MQQWGLKFWSLKSRPFLHARFSTYFLTSLHSSIGQLMNVKKQVKQTVLP